MADKLVPDRMVIHTLGYRGDEENARAFPIRVTDASTRSLISTAAWLWYQGMITRHVDTTPRTAQEIEDDDRDAQRLANIVAEIDKRIARQAS